MQFDFVSMFVEEGFEVGTWIIFVPACTNDEIWRCFRTCFRIGQLPEEFETEASITTRHKNYPVKHVITTVRLLGPRKGLRPPAESLRKQRAKFFLNQIFNSKY